MSNYTDEMSTYRDPKIYVIEIVHKSPYKYPNVVGDYIEDCSLGAAFFKRTKDYELAMLFNLEEASRISACFNKMHPEHFKIALYHHFKVPIEYGKKNYIIPSDPDALNRNPAFHNNDSEGVSKQNED